MAILKIRTLSDPALPDPILRQETKKVGAIDSAIQKLVDDMIDTMRAASGVGLAAPQIGLSLRIAVIEIPETEIITLINPEIVKKQGSRLIEEGCLSLPGYSGQIVRSLIVKVKALDRQGRKFSIIGEDLLAQALEHEIDHLDGILYTDHGIECAKNDSTSVITDTNSYL
jgi:peptide deformylase